MTQPLSAEKKASAEYDQLKETISSLPSKVITEASLEAGHEEYVYLFLYSVSRLSCSYCVPCTSTSICTVQF